MLNVGIIIGSTRPGRKGEAVGKWVYEAAVAHGGANFRTFKPGPQHGASMKGMLDEVISWGEALKTIREEQVKA